MGSKEARKQGNQNLGRKKIQKGTKGDTRHEGMTDGKEERKTKECQRRRRKKNKGRRKRRVIEINR